MVASYGLASVAKFLCTKGDTHSRSMFMEIAVRELKRGYEGCRLDVCRALSRTLFDRDVVEGVKADEKLCSFIEGVVTESVDVVDGMRISVAADGKIASGRDGLGALLICGVAVECGWISGEVKGRVVDDIGVIADACEGLVGERELYGGCLEAQHRYAKDGSDMVKKVVEKLSSTKIDQKQTVTGLRCLDILLKRQGRSFADLETSFPVLKKLAESDDVKVSRVAAWVLKSVLAGVKRKDAVVGSESERDPADYKRLDAGVSFLRAVYENLQGCTDAGKAKVMIDALLRFKIPLPLVDWSRVLMKISGLSAELYLLVLEFTGKNAVLVKSATSFTDVFVSCMTQSLHAMSEREGFVASKKGVGRLMMIAGFGGEGKISGGRVLDVVRGVADWLSDGSRQIASLVCLRY